MLNVNVDRNHTTNRTATCNRPVFLAGAAGLEKYVYGNGFTVIKRISGTVLLKAVKKCIEYQSGHTGWLVGR